MESTPVISSSQELGVNEAGTPQTPVAWSSSDPTNSPTRDSVMSDDTISASINDVEMILNHDTDFDLASPTPGTPLGRTPGRGLVTDVANRPSTPAWEQGTPQQIMTLPGKGTDTEESPISVTEPLKPTLAFTPRRSPRISTPVQNKPEFNTPKQTLLRTSITPTETAPVNSVPPRLQFTPMKSGSTYIFSTPLPSPSIFLSRSSSPFRTQPVTATKDITEEAMTSNLAIETHSTFAAEPNPTGIHTSLNSEPRVESSEASKEGVDMELDEEPTMSTSATNIQLQSQPLLSTAESSSLFASPIPALSQPILSPVRLQTVPFSAPTAPGETPQPSLLRLTSLSPTQTFLLDRLSNGTYTEPQSKVLTFETPKGEKTPSEGSGDDIQEENDSDAGSMEMRIMTPTQRADRNAAVMTMLAIRSPARTPTRPRLNFQSTGSPNNQDSLAPLVVPLSPSRLPFPITPQPSASAHLSRTLVPNPTTPSRLPVPVFANKHQYFIEKSPCTSTDNPSVSTLSTAPIISQGRTQSTLRGASTGVASKIPRPGSSKPYARPISRLPKPKALTKNAVISPPPLPAPTAPKVLQPPPPPPISPIKTRRGRAAANQQAQGASLQRATDELPPDAVILRPPQPRIRTRPDSLIEDPMDTTVESRARSPPTSVPVITPPPPPKERLKPPSKDLSSEAARNGTTIPEFAATAPSLGIFPVTSRVKGRGRTMTRPMMMPLDPTSLRNLTNANTLRNQQYICSTVETQIVMREGKRPASPTTRVKTLLDKKKTEQEKERGERAARRTAKQEPVEPSDTEGEAKKHPRAAGDDEEYKTPTKPRQESEGMDLDGHDQLRIKKRVKWSTNLLQRFEMDANNFEGIRKRAELSKSVALGKRSLTTQVLLDPLGNVTEADIPIPNLPHEQVVVTRIVYIDDLPPSERPKRATTTKLTAQEGAA